MGSSYNVRLKPAAGDAALLHAAVQAALDEVEERMSMFRPGSELSALNRAAGGSALPVSASLYTVLAAARQVSAWSDGAFDVTVAPLVERWGFGTRTQRQVPVPSDIVSDRAQVNWRSLALDEASRSVTKARSGVQLDLGGIAKGYGVDRAAAALEALGIEHYMVEVGGEVRTRGVNAAGAAWRIGIEEPDASPQQARWVVPLAGRAMATSGDYRNYFVEADHRYCHEIDPANGRPIDHALCSVTVVAETCIMADAIATALIVLGAARGRALAERSGIAAQFIERQLNGRFSDSMTSAFAALAAARA
jgi:thiamine biosynthesis lipoprotein